jgi:hypothetical protein
MSRKQSHFWDCLQARPSIPIVQICPNNPCGSQSPGTGPEIDLD